MDALKLKSLFDNRSSEVGIYKAIRDLSSDARKLQKSCDNQISEGQAIQWSLTNIEPDKARIYNMLKYSGKKIHPSVRHIISVTDDILSEVDDEGVCKSVRASIKASNQAKKEKFIYIDISTEGQHSRTRVLTRMILDSI